MDKNLSEEAINATSATNVSGNSSGSDTDNAAKYMEMAFIANLASRPQSTMADITAKPPLRLEMDKYLALPRPIGKLEDLEKNMLQWWADQKDYLPLLSGLAREYLCIPASSSPSERCFSHAGNIITDTRHNLDSDNVSMMLFIKENLHRCKTSWKRWKTKIPEENSWYEINEPSEALEPLEPSQPSQPGGSQSQALLYAPKKQKYDAAARKKYHQRHPLSSSSASPTLGRSPEKKGKKIQPVPRNQPKMSEI
jgi:hAT family C-terminal dimerisation region